MITWHIPSQNTSPWVNDGLQTSRLTRWEWCDSRLPQGKITVVEPSSLEVDGSDDVPFHVRVICRFKIFIFQGCVSFLYSNDWSTYPPSEIKGFIASLKGKPYGFISLFQGVASIFPIGVGAREVLTSSGQPVPHRPHHSRRGSRRLRSRRCFWALGPNNITINRYWIDFFYDVFQRHFMVC